MRPSFCRFFSSLVRPKNYNSNTHNDFQWPSDCMPWWDQTTTSWPNQAPAAWPNQTHAPWPNQAPAAWPNQTHAAWPNQTYAPWPNQSSATWPNQTNAPLPNSYQNACATGCSNGFPVSITNNNYYVPLPTTWPTVPVHYTPLVPTAPVAPVALPAWSTPAALVPTTLVAPVALPAWSTPVALVPTALVAPVALPAWSAPTPLVPTVPVAPVALLAWSAPAPAGNTQPVTTSSTTSSLHPMLCTTPVAYPHLSWSIERYSSAARICTQANDERPLINAELNALAVPPSISVIRIHVSSLGRWERYWGPIIIRQSSTSQGIRNKDVLRGIFNYFQMPLSFVESSRLHHVNHDRVGWEAARRARELPNGGVSRDAGFLRIDVAAISGAKFAGMQPVGGWATGDFTLNLTN